MRIQTPDISKVGSCGLLCLLLVVVIPLRAQITVSVNPANVQDGRVLLTNPAAAAIAEARAYVGLKLIYPGFIPNNAFALKASFFNLSMPQVGQYDFAAGLQGRYFTTPLFQEGRFGALVARHFTERVAIGLDLSLLFKSYNRDNFDLVDPDDPVFRKGTSAVAFDPGVGVYAQLHEKLALAGSLLHLTQPEVALGSAGLKLPLESLIGVSFTQNSFRLDAGVHWWEEKMYPTFGAEVFAAHTGRFRLGYGLDHLLFEGQLTLFSNAALFYSFNLPTSDIGLVSAGSHEAGFVYTFPSKSRRDAERDDNDFSLQSNLQPRLLANVRATVDTVMFTELREVQEELPIIPRLFFPKNSAELAPTRYDLLASQRQDMFASDVREINAAYRGLLNIIAERLRANPSMQVTLQGYSSGAAVEKSPAELSRQRAENVRDYLVRRAGCNSSQVRAEAGEIDTREASARDPLRLEELQRVNIEVRSEDEETLFAPITFEKKELDALPKRCGFLARGSVFEAGLENWKLFILADNDTVGVLVGKQALPDTIWWDWQFGNTWSSREAKFWQEVRYSLWLQDRAGQEVTTPWQNIRSRRSQQRSIHVERIPIILFAFDEYEMDRTSRRLQTKLRQIAGKLRNDPAAIAHLYGHTDAIGDDEHNRQLSVHRAQNVSNELVKMGISNSRLSSFGFSETQPLADNRLPEGRMMNRRVEVHIRHSSDVTIKSKR